MKVKEGFVSNSSSCSFYITNKTSKTLTLLDFAKENLHLVNDFNAQYDWHNFTYDQMIESAANRNEKLKPGDNYMMFGDEQGDVIGQIYDYILRDGGESERFSWRFDEYHR